MKTFRYFVLIILTAVSLGSCVVNKDGTHQAFHDYRKNTYHADMKQAGYESVHLRPPIN